MLDNSRGRFMDTIDIRNSPFRLDYGREISRLSERASVLALQARAGGDDRAAGPRAGKRQSPRARYRVTVPTQIGAWLKRLLPTRLMDRVLLRQR